MFPKMGFLWKQMPISRALPNTSFRVPSKGALPSGSSQRAHTERDAPFPDTSFICLSKSLVNEPPPGFPVGPLWRVMPISKAFSYSSLSSVKDPLLQVPLIELLQREAPFRKPFFNCFSESLVNGTPSSFPQQGPYGERCLFLEPSFTHPLIKTKAQLSLKVPGNGVPLHVPTVGAPNERDALPPEPIIYSLSLNSFQLRSSSTKWGQNICLPSMEPHTDRRPTYNGLCPSSPRESFTTLLSLPQ